MNYFQYWLCSSLQRIADKASKPENVKPAMLLKSHFQESCLSMPSNPHKCDEEHAKANTPTWTAEAASRGCVIGPLKVSGSLKKHSAAA